MHRCKSRPKNWVKLAPNWKNLDFFQIRFQYILALPKCTEIWSEKIHDLSHLGSIWPILGRNLVTQRRIREVNICKAYLSHHKHNLTYNHMTSPLTSSANTTMLLVLNSGANSFSCCTKITVDHVCRKSSYSFFFFKNRSYKYNNNLIQ